MLRQKGLTLSGFILWAVLAIVVALIGFRVGPPYFEFLSIQTQLKAIAQDPEGRTGTRSVVENLFGRRAQIENINAVSAKDLIISKEGDGVVISVDYSTCVPLVMNIRVCMDYKASSAN